MLENGSIERGGSVHVPAGDALTTDRLLAVQHRLALALSSVSDLSEALDQIIEAVLELGEIDGGGVYLVDRKTGMLSLAAHKGLSTAFVRRVSEYPPDSPQAELVNQGRAIYAPYRNVPYQITNGVPDDQISALGIVPVCHDGTVIAALNVASRSLEGFSANTRRAVESIATQIGAILARIEAETAVREGQQNLQNLFNALDDFLFILDFDGNILHTNPVVQARLGYSAEELSRMHVLDVHPPHRRNEAARVVGEMIVGTTDSCLIPLVTKDGSAIRVETKVVVGRWDNHEVIFGVSRDITERWLAEEQLKKTQAELEERVRERTAALQKANEWLEAEIQERGRAQEALKQSEERFRELADSLPETVFECDGAGNLTYVNRTALEVFGYTRDEVESGFNVFQALAPEDRAKAREGMRARLEGRPFENHEYAALRKNGTRFPAMIHSSPIIQDNGFVGLRGLLIDVSERKMFETEILKTQKIESLGVLAGGLAHDYNNLLMAILGNINMAQIYAEGDSRIQKRLNDAERATMRAADLTKQLLTFSKGGAPVKKVMALGDLIRESVRFALSGSSVKCEYEITDDLWPVEVDPGQIGQVLNNLVLNAVQAMPMGGVVRICGENFVAGTGGPVPHSEYVKISVQDEGEGIPDELLQKIFDPYFSTKENGRGLGLAVAYSVMKNHGGHISVESRPQAGTTFTLYLPSLQRPFATLESVGTEPVTGQGKILIMDDEEMVRTVAGEMLMGLGYTVDYATDGAEAIEKYRSAMESPDPFHIVIMDLTIPGGMGGKEAIRKLREIDPCAKAIVSSGYSHDPIMSNFVEYGFNALIAKPYTIADLSRTVSTLL